MQKCGGKFCSKPDIRLDFDVRNCVAAKQNNHPGWKGACFYQTLGKGCPECGGKTIRASGCQNCLDCGSSICG